MASVRTRHLKLCRRICKLMCWEFKMVHRYSAIRKIATDEAVAIGLDRLEEIIKRLEAQV